MPVTVFQVKEEATKGYYADIVPFGEGIRMHLSMHVPGWTMSLSMLSMMTT